MRERPGLRIALEPATPDEQPSLVEPIALTKVVQCLLEMLADNHEGTAIVVRLAQTDLHSALTLLISQPEPPISAESVTQSLPQGLGLSADFESMAHDLRNRDYLRLKRSEALLSRQRGRLLVTPDLSRVRITLSRR
jgi:signal transduction histidine kinase